ncbi:MAG TPA: gfo/Idh/MocA family oxidoreductase [Ktedonobacter sp.]|nr:gfo/Idh/MocA family oxidoreductase [Ktedonobacter sp.]
MRSMSRQTPLRIIQVGLGNWGQSWAKNIVAPNPNVETVAWVEIDAPTLQQAQQRLELPEARCFTSFENALKSVEADAVLITASLPGHVPSAETALRASKHVLIEKPFAPSVADAEMLVSLAQQQGKILMVSQNYRFFPVVRAVTELIHNQTIGRLGVVNIDFRRYDNIQPAEANRHYHIWEPLLVDMSIHHFDLMRMVLNQEPLRIQCSTWNTPWSKYVEPSTGVMTIFFDGGTVVNYRGSWTSTAPQTDWAGEWSMEGEKGILTWTGRGEIPEQATVHLRDEEPQQVELSPLPATDRAGSLNAFVQAIDTGTEPETSGRNNIPTLKLMFAAIESAQKGGVPVDIG